ncbi:hypothetical protein BXZ70DRAFT_1006658 [Cristinia sonorae]|uniref:Uncharacterized protein n=1 Tax=Cristinia sonorae TaxID=1940300 RepID=A0A8K0XRN0_9AGAR|nr:hypothetical protein BXZ70DRAFT_1006658 [Cristinia sonorae]
MSRRSLADRLSGGQYHQTKTRTTASDQHKPLKDRIQDPKRFDNGSRGVGKRSRRNDSDEETVARSPQRREPSVEPTPRTVLQEILDDLATVFQVDTPRAVIPEVRFSGTVLRDARIELSPLSELSLRTWAQVNKVTSLAEVIDEALRRGIPFRLFYPRSALDDLMEDLEDDLQSNFGHTPESPAPSYLRKEHTEPLLPWYNGLTHRDARRQYEYRVAEILQRPHATAFLFKGGIWSRLAVHYGGERLVQRATLQVSRTLLHYTIGDQTTYPRLVAESVSREEEDALIGRCAGMGAKSELREWWPRPETIQFNLGPSAQWSTMDESWFQEHLRTINNDMSNEGPKTRAEWGRFFKHWMYVSREEVVLRRIRSGKEPADLLQTYTDTYGKSWNMDTFQAIDL